MKNFFSIIFILFITSISVFPQVDNNSYSKRINMDNANEYLPEYLINLYLGMPFNDFINIKDTLFLTKVKTHSAEYIEFREDVNENYLDYIDYKFDATPDSLNMTMPLFQIDINFTELEEANKFVREKFGKPLFTDEFNHSQWIFKTNKNFVLIVKQNETMVKLIATIAGSEWDS